MSKIVQPIHVQAVGLANVRYFRAPRPGPHQPWHSVDDLHSALTLPRDLRRAFLSKMKKDWAGDCQTIATASGITTIGPHFMAQGLIGSMAEFGLAPPGFEHAYVLGIVAATQKEQTELGIVDDVGRLNHMVAAFRNSNGMPGPHPVFDESIIVRRPHDGDEQ